MLHAGRPHPSCPPPPAPSLPAGRRRLLHAAAAAAGLASVLASTAPSLWMFTVFRCASGAALGGMGMAAAALAADGTGPSWRGTVGLLLHHFFSGGRWRGSVWPGGSCVPCVQRAAVLARAGEVPRRQYACSTAADRSPPPPPAVGACVGTLLAWCGPGWRLLTFLCGLACLAYWSTWSLAVESPQWLLLHGRKASGGAGGCAGLPRLLPAGPPTEGAARSLSPLLRPALTLVAGRGDCSAGNHRLCKRRATTRAPAGRSHRAAGQHAGMWEAAGGSLRPGRAARWLAVPLAPVLACSAGLSNPI
jgi:MFS family permease